KSWGQVWKLTGCLMMVTAALIWIGVVQASQVSFLTAWGSQGFNNGQLDLPQSVAVDPWGYIYVADTNNHRVQKFSASGGFIAALGKDQGIPGSGNGEFIFPYGVAVDASGNVYVADGGNHRIQKFSANGTFLTKWG